MEVSNGAYPMYFGLACAFAALQHVSRPELSELVLRGCAQLLGLLVDRAQGKVEDVKRKLKTAELEVQEMKLRRTEDAKANEKVVAIFASHEQNWIAERKKLRHQIYTLVRELRNLEEKNKEKVEEREEEIRKRDEKLKEESKKRRELQERVTAVETAAEELREQAKQEAQEHAAELWKHKTAFMELVSDQRQLEAEMSRALRQAEDAKQELEVAVEQKEVVTATVEKFSEEVARLQKDAEQKDKILSAMLRKSKLDTAEKQMLLKEVKISKAKKKQAEMEIDRLRNMWESRHKKSSRDAGSSKEQRAELPRSSGGGYHPRSLLLDYLEAEDRQEKNELAMINREGSIAAIETFNQYSSQRNDEIVSIEDMQQLKDWVRLEAEKYASILDQRHYTEIEAFTEQMRLKDEKLEVYQWQLLSMELELKQLQSHIEGLDGTISQFREENLRLEALLLDREKELKILKEQFDFYLQHSQKSNLSFSTNYVAADTNDQWPEAKTAKKKSREKEQEIKIVDPKKENRITDKAEKKGKPTRLQLQQSTDITTSPTDFASPTNQPEEQGITCIKELYSVDTEETENSPILISKNSKEIVDEEREFGKESSIISKLSSSEQSLAKNSTWKMDIHALGISYKIKRLKQQLIVLEKLAGEQSMKQISKKDDANKQKASENKQQMKGLLLVISLLNKQVKRYQSLEEKTDELCRKMHESYRTGGNRDQSNGRTREQTEMLQRFLEETFQLQRFMVATGQKLMDIESKVACCFIDGNGGSNSNEFKGFNMVQFADVVRNLFKEIQRGLEVRIARIIGDIEGTLACDGILYR